MGVRRAARIGLLLAVGLVSLLASAGRTAAVAVFFESATRVAIRGETADWWLAKRCLGPSALSDSTGNRTIGPGYIHAVSAERSGTRTYGNVVLDEGGPISNEYGMVTDGGLLSFSLQYARRAAGDSAARLSREVGNNVWPPGDGVNNWPVSTRWCAEDGGGGFGVVSTDVRGPFLTSVAGPSRVVLEVTVRLGVPFLQEEYDPVGPMRPADPDGRYGAHLVELVYRYEFLDRKVRAWITTSVSCHEPTCGDREEQWQFLKEPKFTATVRKGTYPNFALFADPASSRPAGDCVAQGGNGGGTTGPAGGPSPRQGIGPGPPDSHRFPAGPPGLCLFGAAKHPLSATWQFPGDRRLQAAFVHDNLAPAGQPLRLCDAARPCLRIIAASVAEPTAAPARIASAARTTSAASTGRWEGLEGTDGLGDLAQAAARWQPFGSSESCASTPTSPNVTRWEAIGHWGTADPRPFDRDDPARGAGAGPAPAWFFHAWEGGAGPNTCPALSRHLSEPFEVTSYFEIELTDY